MISQNQAQKIVKMIQDNGISESESEKLAEMLIAIDSFKKSLSTFEGKIKDTLIERHEGEVFYFPKEQKKVHLREGNSKTEVNAKKVFEVAIASNLVNDFWKAVSLTQSKLSKKLKSAFKTYSKIIPSDKQVVYLGKMTAEELKEHTD